MASKRNQDAQPDHLRPMRRKWSMKNNFDAVQAAAQARNTTTMNSKTLAQQIVAAAQGDARLAYDFMDMLNAHVTRMLQEQK